MFAHNARQLKHRDLRLAEHGQQLGVGVDVAFVGAVLQVFSLDVVPRLFDDLRVGDWTAVDDGAIDRVTSC